MGTRLATSRASRAPAIRPKPQFSQQQMVEMKVVTTMACMLLWHIPATNRSAFLQGLAEAMAEPNTSTRAICMEKASRPQKPLVEPQALSTFSGPILVAIIANTYTMMDRMTANRNGSGSHRLTTRTQPLVNFLNTDSLSFVVIGPVRHNRWAGLC